MAIPNFSDTIFNVGAALTAPGDGALIQVAENDLLSTKAYTLITKVATIDTNVVIRLDGSIDGTTFVPIIGSTTITANGTSVLSVGDRPVKFIKPVWVSEAGGTNAVVTFHVAAA
jgi:hypothetical protein